MINKKNLWFLTLFSLLLVLSVYYVTMPKELLLTNNENPSEPDKIIITETSLIETLKQNDNSSTLEEINKLKATLSDEKSTSEDKNKAFDSLKLLNQISSQEELLEEQIKNTYDIDTFIKIDGDQVRVVIDSSEPNKTTANNIMRTIQDNFDTKKYISIQFK